MGGTKTGIIRFNIYFFVFDVDLKLFEWDLNRYSRILIFV